MSSPRRLDLPLLDALRLLASAVIVFYHMRGDSLFGVAFGLPLFLVIMFGLASGSTKLESVADRRISPRTRADHCAAPDSFEPRGELHPHAFSQKCIDGPPTQ